jgi:hypothetical protein
MAQRTAEILAGRAYDQGRRKTVFRPRLWKSFLCCALTFGARPEEPSSRMPPAKHQTDNQLFSHIRLLFSLCVFISVFIGHALLMQPTLILRGAAFSSFTFVSPTFVPESKKKNAKECGGILR